MSDVVKHEVKSIGEKVSDRIRASFVDLIPEDAWKAMVQKEIVTFTEGVQEPYGRGTKPSPLQSIIRAELESRFKAEVIKAMDAQEFKDVWSNATQQWGPGEFVTKIVRELKDEMVVAMFAGVAQNVVMQIRAQMQR